MKMNLISLFLALLITSCINNESKISWPDTFSNRSMPFRPGDKALCRQNPPDFSWPVVEGTDKYHIQLARTVKMEDIEHEETAIRENYYNFPVIFKPGIWYWRLRFHNDAGWSEWTLPMRFRIDADAWGFPMPPVDDLIARVPVDHPRIVMSGNSKTGFNSIIKGPYGKYIRVLDKSVRDNLNNPLPAEPDPVVRSNDRTLVQPSKGRLINAIQNSVDEMFDNAIIYMLSGDEKLGKKAKERLINIASWDTEGSTSFSSHDSGHRYITCISSLVYDWCYNIMSPEERKIVLDMIKARTERMFHLSEKIPSSPFDSHGWSAYGFLGFISLATLHDLNEAEEWFRKIVPGYINIFPPWGDEDGGWSEGTGYWENHSVRSKDIIYALWKTTGVNLFNKPYSRNEGNYMLYMVPSGESYETFGDIRNPSSINTDMIKSLMAITGVYKDPVLQWTLNQLDTSQVFSPGYISNTFNYFFLNDESVEARAPSEYPASRCFFGTGLAAMHSDLTDPDRISCYFRSSLYGSNSHSHADQNSFLIKAFGEDLAVNSGYYDFYNSRHDSSYTRQTFAHNTITYDGSRGQKVHDRDAVGKLTGFVHHPFFDAVSGDATSAYKGGLERAVRHILYLRPSTFVVVDDLKAGKGRKSEFEWNLHARESLIPDIDQAGCVIEKGEALLKTRIHYPQGIKALLQNKFILPDGNEIPPQLKYADAKGPFRAIFTMPASEQTTIVTTMQVYRKGADHVNLSSKQNSNSVEFSLEDGSHVIIRTLIDEVKADNIVFNGTGVVEREGMILLLSGKKLIKDGKKLVESDKDVTVLMGGNLLTVSCRDDVSLRLYLPGVRTLLDDRARLIPSRDDISYNPSLTGIHWTTKDDYLILDMESGSHTMQIQR